MAATRNRRRPDEKKVSAHWDTTLHPVELTFYGFPALRPYHYRRIAGRAPAEPLGRDWFERWAVTEVLRSRAPVDDCLSICCGFGEIERILARLGAFRKCVGIDLASQAISSAETEARREAIVGLSYEVVDVETATFAPESVDLVWANGALHHIANVEHVVEQAYNALRPGGMLIANEYIGPNHHQLDRRTLELVNALIHLLPDELRSQNEWTYVPERIKGPRWRELAFRLATGHIPDNRELTGWRKTVVSARRALRLRRSRPFGPIFANNPWFFRHVDPSEGVRASEIVPTLQARFDEVDVRPYNGTLLPHVLDDRFFLQYDGANALHAELLDLLVESEQRLIAAGEVAPHHAAIICRKTA